MLKLRLQLRWGLRTTLKGFVTCVSYSVKKLCIILYQTCWNTPFCVMCVHIYLHVYIVCMIVLPVTQTLLIVYVTIVCNKFPHEIICSYKLFVVHYSCMVPNFHMKKLQRLQLAKTDNKQLNENMFVLV